jgi:hypothetical protein
MNEDMLNMSVRRHRQCIDAVILRMGAGELHEGDPPTEIESGHQAIISSRDLETHTLAVQHFGLRSGFLNLIRGCPLRRIHELVPAFERNLCFRVPVPEVDKHVSSNHRIPQSSTFPKREQARLTPEGFPARARAGLTIMPSRTRSRGLLAAASRTIPYCAKSNWRVLSVKYERVTYFLFHQCSFSAAYCLRGRGMLHLVSNVALRHLSAGARIEISKRRTLRFLRRLSG